MSRIRILFYYCLLVMLLTSCGNSSEIENVPACVDPSVRDFPEAVGAHFFVTDSASMRRTLALPQMDSIHRDAKWRLYCVHYADTVFYNSYAREKCNMPSYKLFSEVPLTLIFVDGMSIVEHMGLKDDYILSFSFEFDDYNQLIDSVFLVTDTVRDYYKRIGAKLHYSTQKPDMPTAVDVDEDVQDVDSQFLSGDCRCNYTEQIVVNPFQPEIIKHVREHADKLHPWFLAEARRRGMFDSIKYPPKLINRLAARNGLRQRGCTVSIMGEDAVYIR